MTEGYRYHRPGVHLQFYTEIYDYSEQHTAGQMGEQPPSTHDFMPVNRSEAIHFAPGESDIRGFAVNSPTGSTIGSIEGFLIDVANQVIPYAYVQTEDGRTVVVPINQFTVFSSMAMVTLEGGKDVLKRAPQATRQPDDANRADHFWGEYRRQNAA